MKLQQENHFHFARLLAASLVLFSHAFVLNGGDSLEPLQNLSGQRLDFGHLAVIVFFIMSGFLIAGSWDRKRDLVDFAKSRLSRILPGLAVMLLFCIAVGAMLTTELARYPGSALSYFICNVTLFRGQEDLAGVFLHNAYSPVVNGSLWTLRLEFSCYMLVAVLGYMQWFNKFSMWLVWALACVYSYVAPFIAPIGLHFFRELLPLLVWFASGALVYFYRDVYVSAIQVATLGLLTIVLSYPLDMHLTIISPFLALALIRLIYLRGPLTRMGMVGDYSYGMYIYAFPVQQFFAYILPDGIWWHNFLLAYPVTLLLAICSWFFIERKFIGAKARPRVAVSARVAAHRK